jgi:hypothetical protein
LRWHLPVLSHDLAGLARPAFAPLARGAAGAEWEWVAVRVAGVVAVAGTVGSGPLTVSRRGDLRSPRWARRKHHRGRAKPSRPVADSGL